MNETRGKIDVLGVDRYFLKRRDTFERILNRYAVSTSDCTRIDKAPVSSASRRSVSSDVSPPFFLEPACILVMYYLWLSTDPRRTKPILSSDASGQRARRGNLFDTLYANSAPIASSNSARKPDL